MGGASRILSHRVRVDDEGDEVEMLVLWNKGLGRANSWEAEEALHRDRRDMLLEYWASLPAGGREAALKGTGLESTVFALWYPPLLRRATGKGKGKWELAIEVEYCGYAGTTEVAADLLGVDVRKLMTEYWRQLGGKPRLR